MTKSLAQPSELDPTALAAAAASGFPQAADLILAELQGALASVNAMALREAATVLLKAERISVVGAGRSGLAARMIAMRLMHFGLTCTSQARSLRLRSLHVTRSSPSPGLAAHRGSSTRPRSRARQEHASWRLPPLQAPASLNSRKRH